MLDKIRQLLQKSKGESTDLHLPVDERQTFMLTIGNLPVGELSCEQGEWTFYYSKQFIAKSDEFYPVPGFSNLEKVYKSKSLWPFFLIRIPGLGQPAVKEIIAEEHLDVHNEAQLLKRFGRRSSSNPFILSDVDFRLT